MAKASRDNPYEIYLITGPGLWYVGSTTKSATDRLYQLTHIFGSDTWRSAIQEHGTDAFEVMVIRAGVGTKPERLEREQFWIDFCHAQGIGKSLNVHRAFVPQCHCATS